MEDVLNQFEELASEISSSYKTGAIFGDWISQSVGQQTSSLDYYQAGQIVADMPNDFFVPATATSLADDLIKSEKHHIIQQVLSAEDAGQIEENRLPDYSRRGFVEGFDGIRSPSLLILPSEKGRPKRINDQLGTATEVPYGAQDVDVKFVSSSTYDLERGICLSDQIAVYQVGADSMDTPNNFTPIDGGDFSEDDGVIQLMAGESTVPDSHGFIYRTVFSELKGLSDRTACLIELPD